MKKIFSLVLALVALTTMAFAADLTVDCGTTVRLSATPQTGYHFVEWQAGGVSVSTANPYDVEASNTTYTAVFAPDEYTITYNKGTADGALGSDVTDTKYHGVTLTLRSSTSLFTRMGYYLDGWSTLPAGTTRTYTLGGSYTANGNATLYPYWAPNTNTVYKVEHYKQNTDGSTYPSTPADTDNKTGTTGATTAAAAKTYTGFSAQPFSQMTIAANGSTVVKIYYTRNSYTISYAAGSVTGITGTVASTSKLHDVAGTLSSNTFTRTGYHQDGWSTATNGSSNDYALGGTYPAANNAAITLYPHWAPNTNTAYRVEHYQQNLDGSTYPTTPADTDSKTGTTGATTEASAKTYTGFTAQPFSQTTIAADGSTVVKIYYNRESYLIRFYDGVNSAPIQSATYLYGATVTAPTAPTKAQDDACTYSFDSWSPTLSSTAVGAVDYTAQYTCTPRMYYITFFNWDGTQLQRTEVAYGEMPVYVGATPTKPGATWSGWTPALTTVTGEATYVAKFDAESYTITLAVETPGTGSVTGGGDYSYDAKPTITATPAECYRFVSWKLNGSVVSTSESYQITVTGPATYTAVFEKITYTVTANPDDTSHGSVTVTVAP